MEISITTYRFQCIIVMTLGKISHDAYYSKMGDFPVATCHQKPGSQAGDFPPVATGGFDVASVGGWALLATWGNQDLMVV